MRRYLNSRPLWFSGAFDHTVFMGVLSLSLPVFMVGGNMTILDGDAH